MNTHTIKFGPEKESKDKPVTEPTPRTNKDADKEDPRKVEKKNLD